MALRKPRVYVVNEPLSWNPEDGQNHRKIDLTPAYQHGEIVYLTPPGRPPADLLDYLDQIFHALKDSQPGDMLLPVGHPVLIGWACAIAAHNLNGQLDILHWIPSTRSYNKIPAKLWDAPGRTKKAHGRVLPVEQETTP